MKSVTIWNEDKLRPKVKDLILKPVYEKLKELKYPITVLEGIYLIDNKSVDIIINNNVIDKLSLMTEILNLKSKLDINYYMHMKEYQINNDNVYDVVNDEFVRNDVDNNTIESNINKLRQARITKLKEELSVIDKEDVYNIIENTNELNKLIKESNINKIHEIKTIKNLKYYNTIIQKLKEKLL